MGQITITLTAEQLATFVDCQPGVYNKLDRETQYAVSEARKTPLYAEVQDKLAAAATALFSPSYCDRAAGHRKLNHPALKTHAELEASSDAWECEGHPADEFGAMGVTTYCDGSCA
jgi:hypothetical protein